MRNLQSLFILKQVQNLNTLSKYTLTVVIYNNNDSGLLPTLI